MKNGDKVVVEKKPPTKEQIEYVEKLCKDFKYEAKSKPDLLGNSKDSEEVLIAREKNIEKYELFLSQKNKSLEK